MASFVIRRGRAVILAVIVSLCVAAPLAAQQESVRELPVPRIAVIDFRRAVRDSAAGKSVARQISERHAKFQKEIQTTTDQLEQTRQELTRQQTILVPEVFQKKRRKFQLEAQEYQKNVQQAQRQLDAMLRQGMNTVEAALAKVLRELATELGANLVIDAGPGRGTVLFTDALLIVTQDAIARLDKVLPDVKVVEPAPFPAIGGAAPRLQMPRAN
jgi:Skp family chaperone for outer membrane proteins